LRERERNIDDMLLGERVRGRERGRERESCEAPLRERDGEIKIVGSYERNRDR